MKKNNGAAKGTSGKKKQKVVFAGGGKCVYCGGTLKETDEANYIKVAVLTKSFPVCSEACRTNTEGYVQRDKKLKKYMYLMVMTAAVCILISAISGIRPLMSAGMAVAGAAFVVLPYPISMFETFQSTPVRTVTAICRAVGIILAGLAVITFMSD